MVSVCPEETALKNNEKEVVDSLLNANLDSLFREALEIGVVPQNVRDDVKSMDWDHVPRPRVIRYLLMHVYRAIEDSPRLYERWLDVLSKHVSSGEDVLARVRRSYIFLMRPHQVLAQTMTDDHAAANESASNLGGAKRPRTQNTFEERHVSILTEILATCATKWNAISISLGLPEHVRTDLRLVLLTHDSIACFNRVLWEWIVENRAHARDPTLENLEEALKSQTVGLGAEADRLRDSVSRSGILFATADEEPLHQKRPRLEDLSIARQSSDSVVAEGKSTLLEVQAVTSGDTSISYQWFKSGCCLGEQCREEILCISNSDLSSEGTYTCQVTDGSADTTSRPINLSVNISSEKKILVEEEAALKNNENGVVDSLLNADLDCLSREALEMGVIPQNVRDDVKSMDWDHVPRPRVIRYLLMHVYRAIEDSPRLYERWLDILSKHVSSVEVLARVRRSYIFLMQPHQVLAQTMTATDDHAAANESASNLGGARRPRTQNTFEERHVSILTEILATCAAKWNAISISLGLPEHVRTDLRLVLLTHDSIACFNRVLWEWIVGNHAHARDPTLENLEEALKSQTVGLGAEADRLRDSVSRSGILFATADEEPLPQKRPRLEDLSIAHQSSDTVVTEGKSTLLEVQPVTSGDTSISYQWFKEGCCLGEQYREEILCISNSDLSSEGTYTCQVTDGSADTTSRPIQLIVNISSVKKILVDRYSTQPEVPEDSWPPAGANTYINLALIKPEKAGEYAQNTVQGNIDDIIKDKESIEYDTVFTNFNSATRLLTVLCKLVVGLQMQNRKTTDKLNQQLALFQTYLITLLLI